MTALEFVKLVEQMRMQQRMYFRTRSPQALENSKDLEFQVDLYIADTLHQPTLF